MREWLLRILAHLPPTDIVVCLRLFSGRKLSWILFLLLGVLVPPAVAQEMEQKLPRGERIAQFQDARDLAVDDQGMLYVLDAETATVNRFTEQGQERQALTATDATGDAFSEPVDLDPTNGLTLLVADAGREELQWYSRSFRLVETRALVPTASRQSRRSGYGRSELANSDERGRPTAVISAVTGEVFAIDEVEGVTYKWDPSGRFDRVIGREGDGRSVEPVDLAVVDDLLLAADAGRDAVVVYDLFGSFVRLVAKTQAADARAISTYRNHMYITLPQHVLVYSVRGRLLHQYSLELDEPLVDCVRTDDALYVLTQTELFQIPTR